jgi:hypothetical protein
MKFTIQAVVQLHCTQERPNTKPTASHVDIALDFSKPIDTRAYHIADGVPNEAGAKAMTQAFVHGLNANIQAAHAAGLIDSAAHLRYVIEQLETLFVSITETTNSKMKII